MNAWNYEPASDLDKPLFERLRQFPREPDMLVYGVRSLAALGLRAWLKCYHRLEISGADNLPKSGSYIIVANHASHLDTLCLLAALPLRKLHRVFPAAAQDYFFVSVPRLAVAAVIVNALPFARRKNFRHSIELCRQLLANPGNILIVFPEGTRTATGQIGDFKPGVGLMVAGTGIPVVPCHLQGAFEAYPKGGWCPLPRKLRLRIGAPRRFAGVPAGKDTAERISAELRGAVLELAGRHAG